MSSYSTSFYVVEKNVNLKNAAQQKCLDTIKLKDKYNIYIIYRCEIKFVVWGAI